MNFDFMLTLVCGINHIGLLAQGSQPHYYFFILMFIEERRTYAAIHPGSEHHHSFMCIMGLGGGHRVHCACAVH